MDRHDRLRAYLDGADCTVCGGALDAARIRLLAERDDLAFVELPCAACGTASLGMVTLAPENRAALDLVLPDRPPTAGHRGALSPPIGFDDVLAMRRLLAGYRGDLRGLLEPHTAGPDAGSGATR